MDMDGTADGDSRARPAVSLLEISRVLDETSRLLRNHPAAAEEPEPRAPMHSAPGSTLIRAMIAVRRRRRDYFPIASGDPAWSMLLELYAAHLEGRRFHQTRLGVASGVPQTTALRLTRKFLDTGICGTRRDPTDKRLLLIGLSDSAAARMSDYLQLGAGIEALLS